MHQNQHRLRATLFVIAAAICWGLIGLFSRALINVNITPVQISLLRSLITFVSVVLLIVVKDVKMFRIKCSDLWIFAGSGILSIAFFNLCYFISITENSLSLAAILLYTAPAFVVLLSALLFKETLTFKKLVALILAFVGCVVAIGLIGSTMQTSWLGLATGIGSGLGYALYTIFSRFALKKYSLLTSLCYTFLFSFLSLLPFSNYSSLLQSIISSPLNLFNTLAIGLVSTLIPFLLYTRGLEVLEAGTASILTFVEPVVATIIGVFVFSEPLTIYTFTGILLIVVSLVVLNVNTARDL